MSQGIKKGKTVVKKNTSNTLRVNGTTKPVVKKKLAKKVAVAPVDRLQPNIDKIKFKNEALRLGEEAGYKAVKLVRSIGMKKITDDDRIKMEKLRKLDEAKLGEFIKIPDRYNRKRRGGDGLITTIYRRKNAVLPTQIIGGINDLNISGVGVKLDDKRRNATSILPFM